MTGGEHGLIVLPTGAGKSLVAAEIMRRLYVDHGARVLLATHVSELVSQNAATLQRHWPDAPIGIYHAGLGKRDGAAPICFAGVHSIYKRPDVVGDRHVIIIDEAHLLSHKDDGMYRKLISHMEARVSGLRVAGLTATPYRLSTGRLDQDFGKHKALFSDIVYEEPIARLIERGYLAPVVPYVSPERLDITGVRTSAGDYNQGDLQAVIDKQDINARIVQEIIHAGEQRDMWLVFASGVEHAHHLTALLRDQGIRAECVTGETAEPERKRFFADAREGKIRALVGMNVMTTGLDIPNIDLIACVRPTKSLGLWCLDMDTEILTSHGWKSAGEINKGDCVPSADLGVPATVNDTLSGKWARVTGTLVRPMREEEKWIEHDGVFVNFRVTSNHTMIAGSRWAKRGRRDIPWSKHSALSLASCYDAYVPVAVSMNQPGLPLTDAELYFLGMVLTDGTVSPSQVGISQSERHPEVLDRIERCLSDCGFKYRKSEVNAWAAQNITERNKRWIFKVSVNPKNGEGAQRYAPFSSSNCNDGGCRHLMPYLDKNFSPLLMLMSRAQFLVFLCGLHDGDGFKTQKCKSVDYTVRSFVICSAREGFINALQMLAVLNGFGANVRKEPRDNGRGIYVISISPKNRRVTKRSNFKVAKKTNENVWCIETETGTIITRRKGRVVVMGNCQMVGRGTRTYPGKDNCLLLDFTDNCMRLGPIDQIDGSKAAPGAKGSAPMRACPECNHVHHISLKLCPECSNKYPDADLKYQSQSRASALLSTQEVPQYFMVDQVSYHKHRKKEWQAGRMVETDAPPSLRIDYLCGLILVSHWVPLESERGRALAARWWRHHSSGGDVPATVDEALSRSDEIKVPGRVMITRDGKRRSVTAWDYSIAPGCVAVERAL